MEEPIYECSEDPRMNDKTLLLYVGVASKYTSQEDKKKTLEVIKEKFGEESLSEAENTIISHLDSCEECRGFFGFSLGTWESLCEQAGLKNKTGKLQNENI